MNVECKLKSDATIVRFCVTDKGEYDGELFWTDAVISVENWCFNYKTSSSCLEFSELIGINDKIRSLLNGEITAVETMKFIEPDIQIVLKPKNIVRESGKPGYVKEGYGVKDISAEFLLFPFLGGGLTEQHYVVPLYRDNLVILTEYLSAVIKKLQ